MYTCIDITQTSKYDNKFYSIVEWIVDNDEELRNNYIGLKKDFFECLTLVFDKNEDILAFSGLQLNANRWSSHIGRILTRTYFTAPNRMNNFMTTIKYCTAMLPIQFEYARKNKLDSVFFSRESGPRSLRKICDVFEKNIPNIKFTYDSDKYNVCGKVNPIPPGCAQYVAKCHLTEYGEQRWRNSLLQII